MTELLPCQDCRPNVTRIGVHKDERGLFYVMCECGVEGEFAQTREGACALWNKTMRAIISKIQRKDIICVACGTEGFIEYLSFLEDVEAEDCNDGDNFKAYIRNEQAFGRCKHCGCDNGINNNPPSEDAPLRVGTAVRLPATGEVGIVVQSYRDQHDGRRCDVLFYGQRPPSGEAKEQDKIEPYILSYFQGSLEVLHHDFKLPILVSSDIWIKYLNEQDSSDGQGGFTIEVQEPIQKKEG